MRKTKAIEACTPCLVLRDQQEKDVVKMWDFPASDFCAGTREVHLATGDYTIEGFEKYVVIERKGTVDDFVNSMGKKRFKAELVRMSQFRHAFVVLEFPIEELERWPASCLKNPWIKQKQPFQHRGAAFAAYVNLKMTYPYVEFVFAGSCGKRLAGSIFRRVIEAYAKEVVKENEI